VHWKVVDGRTEDHLLLEREADNILARPTPTIRTVAASRSAESEPYARRLSRLSHGSTKVRSPPLPHRTFAWALKSLCEVPIWRSGTPERKAKGCSAVVSVRCSERLPRHRKQALPGVDRVPVLLSALAREVFVSTDTRARGFDERPLDVLQRVHRHEAEILGSAIWSIEMLELWCHQILD
jgi:hypothetical protein